MPQKNNHLEQSVLASARKDFAALRQDLTIQEALNNIRRQGVGEKIVYFYVVDELDRLVGVVPTRRLLTSAPDQRLKDIMISRVVTLPRTATVLEACELFVVHKFLAFPVIDEERRIQGIVDVELFTREVLNIAEPEPGDDVFEAIGFHVSQVRDASAVKGFRFRFPWLVPTILSGLLCALLASAYEMTLTHSIVLAFFLALVLGLGESVSIQSMTVTIQTLRVQRPSWKWYWTAFRRELATAAFLGIASGILASFIAWLWRGSDLAVAAVGLSIFLSLCSACFFGLTVPTLLHGFRLDPKIAAGPVTLALTDLFTLFFYFTVGTLLLR
jgi:magnesium transporter